MSERIESLAYKNVKLPSGIDPDKSIDGVETDLFLSGPAEFLIARFCEQLKLLPTWTKLFGEFIDPYPRMDYGERNLPVMRVYTEKWRRTFETWYLNGDMTVDMVWPPLIRREELQQWQMTIAGAMEQQLSSDKFMTAMRKVVPGLNELGKTIDVDMALGFQLKDSEAIVPLTRLKVNYRINLQEWADYMESDDRTLDEPFQRTLVDLRRIYTTIEALRSGDPEDVELSIEMDQKV